MGKRKPGKGKAKVVLSLAEFTQDVQGAGKDEDIAALPTAPKAAEEWEAEGGRPEYNSRGYKERSTTHRERNYDADAEFEDRDWTRRGPLEERQGPSFGGGAERDWSGIRRGPLEAEDEAEAAPERDWQGIRRGPVESSFQSNNSVERDWSARKGPIEAEGAPARNVSDDQWSKARHGPIEAEFTQQKKEQDWTVRRPIEAGNAPAPEPADWTARKGPVEAEFATPTPERDWTARKGPIEAEVQKESPESNWADVRRRPVKASFHQEQTDVDWSARKGPIDTEVEKVGKAVRDIDFSDKRGAKLQEIEENKELEQEPVKKDVRDNWRRAPHGDTERGTRLSGSRISNSSSQEQLPVQKERDWGAARRRSHPVEARLSPLRRDVPKKSTEDEAADAPANDEDRDDTEQVDGESDWTTVRSNQRRPTGSNRRHSGKGFNRRGPRPFGKDNANESMSRADFSAKGDAGSHGPKPVASATTDA